MHASSMENMRRCRDKYVSPSALADGDRLIVLDIGAADYNGSYKEIFDFECFKYVTADLTNTHDVDVVMENPYHIPLDDKSVDIVLSGQMLEHAEFFWLVFAEMARVLRDDGCMFIIAPSAGPIHRYPVDCYRFYPDAYTALAKHSGLRIQACWLDDRGPWNDLVAVFVKEERVKNAAIPELFNSLPKVLEDYETTPDQEETKGKGHYLKILATLHENLSPDFYLEIGVRRGNSFKLAKSAGVAVDPAPLPDFPVRDGIQLFKKTSDEFFRDDSEQMFKARPINLAFIDGMHLFEFALRDFMNVERYSNSTTVVVVDDIFPNHPDQASRERITRVWTGDVWKLYYCLRIYRPDLVLLPLDTAPTGLLLVTGLNKNNRTLWQRYNPIVREFSEPKFDLVPQDILSRQGAREYSEGMLRELMLTLQQLGKDADPLEIVVKTVTAILARDSATNV